MGKLSIELPNEPFYIKFTQSYLGIAANSVFIVTKYFIEIGSLEVKLKLLGQDDYIIYNPSFMSYLSKDTTNPN